MQDTCSLSYEIRMPLTQSWTAKVLNCTLHIGGQVLFCLVVMILPLPLLSTSTLFCQRRRFDQDCPGLRQVGEKKKNDLTKTRAILLETLSLTKKSVLVPSER